MKVSKEQSQANRQAIVEAAARLYRERGLEGVGVAEIMAAAGFTHGGFYGHFDSKEALAAEACEHALKAPLARLRGQLESGEGARPYFDRYLRTEHRDAPGLGCAMPTLAVDAGRASPAVSAAITSGIAGYLEAFATHRPDGTVAAAPDEADKARAIMSLSVLVGGMVLARATGSAAPALSDEIIDVLKKALPEYWDAS
ncbi:TetR/AcrR family transcriptional regulator [Pelomonas sp. KK5]|uniref:TetR/AcrR family transcriptional regulator n=1 Tax=Pelomonas sp. KK5 TaxID=1855730 RepID=UPI00097BE0C5|nr:TetR/AcrR family transcriptional regulator [Pelomonas sp. KK5]